MDTQIIYSSTIRLIALVALVAGITRLPAADFVQNSDCGLTNPAFLEKFGTAHSGGHGGDLDESIWTVARMAFMYNNTMSYYQADIPACKQGAPALAWPDSEILVCDNTIPGYSGRLMVPNAGQNYGLTAFRANQPFDFTGRTGTIAFDVDDWMGAACGGIGHYVSMMLTEDPLPAPNIPHWEHSGTPKDGLVFQFNNCDQIGYCYTNFSETILPTNRTGCVTTKEGSLNHFEVRVGKTHIEVWASDYSTDGVTFPNFRQILTSDAYTIPFTRGYVAFGVNNHATIKYGCVKTGVHYWDNIGFDGPVISADRVYALPNKNTLLTTDANSMDLGYQLQSTVIKSFTIKNVDLTNATGAKVTLSGMFMYSLMGAPDWTITKLRTRINGGTWHDRLLTQEEHDAFLTTGNNEIPMTLPVPLADFVQGDNTLEIASANGSDGYPITIANVAVSFSTSTPTRAVMPQVREKINSMLQCRAGRPGMNSTINIQVPAGRNFELAIFSAAGHMVRRLAHGIGSGEKGMELAWDGTDNGRHGVNAGVYVVKLSVNGNTETANLVWVK